MGPVQEEYSKALHRTEEQLYSQQGVDENASTGFNEEAELARRVYETADDLAALVRRLVDLHAGTVSLSFGAEEPLEKATGIFGREFPEPVDQFDGQSANNPIAVMRLGLSALKRKHDETQRVRDGLTDRFGQLQKAANLVLTIASGRSNNGIERPKIHDSTGVLSERYRGHAHESISVQEMLRKQSRRA